MRSAAFKEGMKKQLRFLQDIPQDQRTQRHTMQIEYYILAEKCAETSEKTVHATSLGVPLHVTAAKLGDPVALHTLLARTFFLGQVCIALFTPSSSKCCRILKINMIGL